MGIHTTSTNNHRARWAAIGAAVAVSLGAGSIGLAQATSADGASAYVPITPCRLADTRPAPDNVGTRTSPLGAADTHTFNGWASAGDTGDCAAADLPDGATALELNVTAVGPSQNTYLTFWPADASKPLASNLNPAVGQSATPNSVSVTLSPTGQFNVFNFQGRVDVIIDVVGVYTDHDHDDRYYTKRRSDARYYTKGQSDDLFHTGAEVDGAIGAAIDGHDHNDVYYTEPEVDGEVADAIAGHAHNDLYYTEPEVDGAISDAIASAGERRTLSQGIADTIKPYECVFVFAYGVGLDSNAGTLVTGYILGGNDEELPSIDNQTAFRPGTVFRTSQGGSIGYIEACNLSATAKDLPAGWKVVTN